MSKFIVRQKVFVREIKTIKFKISMTFYTYKHARKTQLKLFYLSLHHIDENLLIHALLMSEITHIQGLIEKFADKVIYGKMIV